MVEVNGDRKGRLAPQDTFMNLCTFTNIIIIIINITNNWWWRLSAKRALYNSNAFYSIQSVRSCRPRTMEQSSIAPEGRWLNVQWIPAVAKDISFWIVWPRRSVNLY